MSPFLLGADHLHPSQHFSSFAGWTFTGLFLPAFVPGHWHAAAGSGEELMQSTHTGYIWTKAWQHAGWATLCLLSLQRNKTTWAWSITHEPFNQAAILLTQNLLLSFFFTKTREKTVSIPRSDTLIQTQPNQNGFKIISFIVVNHSYFIT